METYYIRTLNESLYTGGKRAYGVEILNSDMTHNQTITSVTLKAVETRLLNMNYNVIRLKPKTIY